jgi:hypothetical protein
MSSSRTLFGALVTTGFLTLGGPALRAYTLDHPNYSEGVAVLDVVPQVKPSAVFFAAYNNHDRDEPSPSYIVPPKTSTMGSDASDQSEVPPVTTNNRDRVDEHQ